MTFDGAQLDLDDASELGEPLTFLRDWLSGSDSVVVRRPRALRVPARHRRRHPALRRQQAR